MSDLHINFSGDLAAKNLAARLNAQFDKVKKTPPSSSLNKEINPEAAPEVSHSVDPGIPEKEEKKGVGKKIKSIVTKYLK